MGIHLNSELERRIAEKVESGRYKSVDEVVEKGLDLLEERDATIPADVPSAQDDQSELEPIWEKIMRLGKSIPDEAWADVPTDLAKNWEHYRYGAPKESE